MPIASHLSPSLNRRIAAAGFGPVVPCPTDRPWLVPETCDILLSQNMAGWRHAPAEPPPGWPGALRWIQLATTGVESLPPWLLRPVPVSCGRGTNAVSIAEFVLAALLARVKRWDEIRVRDAAGWTRIHLNQLAGQTLGLLGLGSIGTAVASRALAFGMTVVALRRTDGPSPVPGVRLAPDLATVLATADHLAVTLPQTAATRHLLDRAAFRQARPGLHLVNVSRGGVIDHDALLEALDAGRVGAATLDVTEPEPLPAGHPLYRHPQVRLSAHLSWSAPEADENVLARILANLAHDRAGEPLEALIDPDEGY